MEELKTIKAPPGTVFVDGPSGPELWFTNKVSPSNHNQVEFWLPRYSKSLIGFWDQRVWWASDDGMDPEGFLAVERWRFIP